MKRPRRDTRSLYQTTLYHAHGIVQKEYVTVPAELLVKTDELAPYFQASFDYAKTLKPKATKRAPVPWRNWVSVGPGDARASGRQ
jgi:hypothetical protein